MQKIVFVVKKLIDVKKKSGSVRGYNSKSQMTGIEMIKTLDADILIETTASNYKDAEPGMTHIITAMKRKMHVITVNKGPLALAFPSLMELAEFNQVLLDATPVTLVARTDTGEIGLCTESFWSGALPAHETLREISLQLLKSGESRLETIGQYEYFLRPFTRPWRLVVVGAAQIAQPLVTMANDAGFDVTIIDPRRGYATETRFPSVNLVHEWPDTALPDLLLDGRSAVITLSHDPKIDDPALAAALASPAFYIGALGSQRNHKKRLERLAIEGFEAAKLARIRGPVGLDIGGIHPNEIAVSILAEIIAVKNGKPLGDTTN